MKTVSGVTSGSDAVGMVALVVSCGDSVVAMVVEEKESVSWAEEGMGMIREITE